jgi:hypothetical protein
MPSRSCILAAGVPEDSDAEEWFKCARKVIKETLGMGMKKGNAANTYQISPLAKSVWSTLGVDLNLYVRWLLEGGADKHIPSPCVLVLCDLCDPDGDGPDVECVYQRGLARCTSRSSEEAGAHRDIKSPLDVGKPGDFTRRVARIQSAHPAAAIEIVDEEEEEEVKVDGTLVDRVLRFMGFVDGIHTSSAVRLTDVRLAVERNSPLSALDQSLAESELGVSLSNLQVASVRRITGVLQKATVNAGFTLKNKLLIRNATDSRVYTIQQ